VKRWNIKLDRCKLTTCETTVVFRQQFVQSADAYCGTRKGSVSLVLVAINGLLKGLSHDIDFDNVDKN
jgi:hypothetical protein